MPDPSEQKVYDCIVLGAGIAGITAARNLQRAGLQVLLLEGANRIGGRMDTRRDTVRNPDYRPDPGNPEEIGKYLPIEAGAEYIHVTESERYQEFWNEIKGYGFEISKFHKTGSLIPPEEPRNRTFFPSWKRTKTALESLADTEVLGMGTLLFNLQDFEPGKQEDLSARAYLNQQGYEGRGFEMAQYTLSAHTPSLVENLSIAGLASDAIPAQLLEEGEFRLERDPTDPREQRICGYISLPERMLAEFEKLGGVLAKSDGETRNRKVTGVRRAENGRVVIETSGGEAFQGRAAICTFSVGMLDPISGEGDAIFGPLLTPAKRTALEVADMGAITKFSLEFKERVWGDDGLWSGHMSVLSNPTGEARTFFSAFPEREQGPHVLTGLLMSVDHEKIRDKTDTDAIQHLLDALQVIFAPDATRWRPEGVLVGEHKNGSFVPNYVRQDWSKDEFAKGGNSYLRFVPKDERKMPVTEVREALKSPLETLPVFWAGEATAPAYEPNFQPLSVHGAYISGVHAAADVEHFLTLAKGKEARFAKYYRNKYAGKTRDVPNWFERLIELLFR